jgi:hypothetical protein
MMMNSEMIRRKEVNVGFAVFRAETRKSAVFWDIKNSSYLTRNILFLRYRAQPVNAM